MNRDEIIATMVKGRECCRQVLQLYEAVRDEGRMTKGSLMARRSYFARANASLGLMLEQMRLMPARPIRCLVLEEDRRYAANLFGEMSGLLEKVMILEREVRGSIPAGGRPAAEQIYGSRCMKAYATGRIGD